MFHCNFCIIPDLHLCFTSVVPLILVNQKRNVKIHQGGGSVLIRNLKVGLLVISIKAKLSFSGAPKIFTTNPGLRINSLTILYDTMSKV